MTNKTKTGRKGGEKECSVLMRHTTRYGKNLEPHNITMNQPCADLVGENRWKIVVPHDFWENTPLGKSGFVHVSATKLGSSHIQVKTEYTFLTEPFARTLLQKAKGKRDIPDFEEKVEQAIEILDDDYPILEFNRATSSFLTDGEASDTHPLTVVFTSVVLSATTIADTLRRLEKSKDLEALSRLDEHPSQILGGVFSKQSIAKAEALVKD